MNKITNQSSEPVALNQAGNFCSVLFKGKIFLSQGWKDASLGLINRSINFHATIQETTLGGLRTNVYDRQSEEREPRDNEKVGTFLKIVEGHFSPSELNSAYCGFS